MSVLTRSDPQRINGFLYETTEQRADQLAVMLKCQAEWGGVALDLGRGWPVDYAVVREGLSDPLAYASLQREDVIGHVEIKCRDNDLLTYPTLFFEVAKRHALLDAKRALGGYARFVVRYNNGDIYWVEASSTLGMYVAPSKRNRPGEKPDLCAHIPIGRLIPLKPPPIIATPTGPVCVECKGPLRIRRSLLAGYAEGVCRQHGKQSFLLV